MAQEFDGDALDQAILRNAEAEQARRDLAKEEEERKRREAEAEALRKEAEEKARLEELKRNQKQADMAVKAQLYEVYKKLNDEGKFENAPTLAGFALWLGQVSFPKNKEELGKARSKPTLDGDHICSSYGKGKEMFPDRKRDHHGHPLPSAFSLCGGSVNTYEDYNDMRLWVDADAYIGDVDIIAAIETSMLSFVRSYFNKVIVYNMLMDNVKALMRLARFADTKPTSINDGIFALFNEMCLCKDKERKKIFPGLREVAVFNNKMKNRIPNFTKDPKRDKRNRDSDSE